MDDSYILVATREMDAPADRVWAAWVDAATIARWWGPAGFHSTVRELDVREGGRFEVIMHGPDGTDYPNLYVFDQVERPTRLVYTSAGSEELGLAPFQSVVEMESPGNRTRVVLKARFASEGDRRRHAEEFQALEGARQLLQRLEEQSTRIR